MDFTHKAQFVAGGHMTEAPSSMTYSCVVLRDSIQLAFLIAALNNIDIMSVDLENAFIQAPCHEKIWFEGGLECDEDYGKVCVIVHSLYGLKSAGTAFCSSLAQALQDLGYLSTKADLDVWICKAIHDDGHLYCEMLFVYVDDILALSHQAETVITKITQFFTVKEGSMKPPEIYLGANISKIQTLDGCKVWATSPHTYVKNSIQVVDPLLEEDGEGFTPFPVLSHLEAAYHIFRYLKKHPDMGCLAFDPKAPDINEQHFYNNANWKESYGNVEEELLPNMPKPWGHSVSISAFVNANHAGNVVT